MELKSDSYVSATDDSCKDFQVLDELILNPSLCEYYNMYYNLFCEQNTPTTIPITIPPTIFGMFVKYSMYFRVFAILIKAIYCKHHSCNLY